MIEHQKELLGYCYMTSSLQRVIHQQKMRAMMGLMPPERYNAFLEWIWNRIDWWKGGIKKQRKGVARARWVQQKIDLLILQDRRAKHTDGGVGWKDVKCKSGCSSCCHIQVEITPDEAEQIARAVKAGVTIDRGLLERQAAIQGDAADWYRHPKEERKCVFLDAKGLCRIYNFRPVACRKYYVFTDPAICGRPEPGQQVGVLSVNEAEILASAAYDLARQEDPGFMGQNMTRLLLERLQEKEK